MRAKNVFLTILITLITATLVINRTAEASTMTSVSVSPLITYDQNLTPGSTFTVNVTVANVEQLWGYQYAIYYNTTILTTINYTNVAYLTYEHLTEESPSGINDTAGGGLGWVVCAYHSYMGDPVGLTTVDPVTLTTITFQVDALGIALLDINGSAFGDVYGDAIKPGFNLLEVDGYFSNTEPVEVHDIAVTAVSASPTVVKVGESVSINVTVANNGDFAENFTVTAHYNETATKTKEIDTETVTDLAIGASTTLIFTWDTTGVAKGEYAISATAHVTDEATEPDNTLTGNIVTVESEAGSPWNIMYIGAGIIVIVIVIIAVYALKARK